MSKINYDILGDGLIVNHEEVSTYGAFGKCFKMTTVYCDDMPAEYSPKVEGYFKNGKFIKEENNMVWIGHMESISMDPAKWPMYYLFIKNSCKKDTHKPFDPNTYHKRPNYPYLYKITDVTVPYKGKMVMKLPCECCNNNKDDK